MKRKTLAAAFALLVLLGWGCIHRGNPPSNPTPETMKPGNMTPFDDSKWMDGPTILPKDKLLKALQEKQIQGKRRLWRLPVVIELAPGDARAYRKAMISVEPAMSAEDRIDLWLEDSALGVSLEERVRQYCPNGGTCSLWVAGYWGSEMLTTGGNEGDRGNKAPYPFSLRSVIGTQAAADASNSGTIVKYRDQ
jgi:hypothetical protein